MPSEVLIYLGPVRCGKTREMLRQYRDALRRAGTAGAIDRTLWLAPTARSAAAIRQQLVADDLDACLSPGVLTFDQLTELILSSGEAASAARMTAAARRELLRRVIKTFVDGDQLSHFRGAANQSGFIDLVAGHIGELNEHGIDPAAYAKAGSQHDRAAEHRELALIYNEYERQLDAHQLSDNEGRHIAACELLSSDSCPRLRELELVVADGFSDFTRTQHELLRLLAQRARQLLITLPTDHSQGRSELNTLSAPGSAGGRADIKRPPRRKPPAEPGAVSLFSDTPASHTRPDLFAKTISTLAELQHFHPKLGVQSLPARPVDWPALDHLAQHLFRNPRQVPPLSAAAAESLNQLEVIAAAGPHDEIVQIARHIKKRLIAHHASPGDIVIAFRSLADAAPRIREVFDSFGIPYSLETGLPLATAPILRTLLSLLRLDQEDWPFRRVVAVLTNNTLTAIDDDARRAADWLVRDLQIASGRSALLKRLEQLATADDADKELSEHSQRRAALAKLALPALQTLNTALDLLPKQAAPKEWFAALEHFGAQLGLPPLIKPPDDRRTGHFSDQLLPDAPSTSDHTAWLSIAKHFAALNRLDIALGESPRPLTRRDLLQWLIDLAAHESLPRPSDDTGRVRILSAATARTISAPHLYLAGMSEQAFPSPERAGLLATGADYRFFAGVSDQAYAAACPPAVNRPQEEMLLFYEVLTRAEKSLTISYPALDDKAQVLPPSPYVTEILRTLNDSAGLVKRTEPHLSPVPPASESPNNLTDWRIQAVAQAIGKEPDLKLLAGLFQSDHLNSEPGRGHHREVMVGPRPEPAPLRPLAAALEAGLRITHARQQRDNFGPAEGLLTSPAVAARLAERFGPTHLWSPSQWERYAVCPYQFFLQNVLKLEPLGDIALETDHRSRGSLLHQVLATFHRQFGASPAESWKALRADEERFIAEMSRTLQSAVDARPRAGIDAALLELDRRQIEKWTTQYRLEHEKYDAAWPSDVDDPLKQAYFEFRFGPRRPGDDGPEDTHSTDDVLELDIGGETIRITGRIDRIDVGRAGDRTVFNVIDYKSGRRPTLSSEKVASGERLQPAVYVMAAEVLLFGPDKATPQWAGYWSMQNGVTTKAQYSLQCSVEGFETDDWADLKPKIIHRIGQFVADIRHGDFPVASRDPDCTSRCEFKTVCRIGQIRSLDKIWTSPTDPA